jgi:hypothetical protein
MKVPISHFCLAAHPNTKHFDWCDTRRGHKRLAIA